MSALNKKKKVNQLLQSIDQGGQMLTDTDASHGVNNKESLTQLASAVISEQQEKERRQLNIVVHNIEESSSEVSQMRIPQCYAQQCSIGASLSLAVQVLQQKPAR